jgi:hypothetical protein
MELHHEMLHQLTHHEKQHQIEVMHHRQHQQQQRQQNQSLTKREIRVSFTFESGPMLNFKGALDHLWKQHYHYHGSSMIDVKLKIGTVQNKSLSHLLIRKKPPKSLLRILHSTTNHTR